MLYEVVFTWSVVLKVISSHFMPVTEIVTVLKSQTLIEFDIVVLLQ